jgi:hypothetical protein
MSIDFCGAERRQAPGPHRDPPIAGAHHKLNLRIRVSGVRQRADGKAWEPSAVRRRVPTAIHPSPGSPQAQSANPGERRASARRLKSMGAGRRQAPGPHRDPSIAGLTPGAHHKLNLRIRVSGVRQRADGKPAWSRAPSGAGSPPRSTHRRADARRSPQTKQTECVSAPMEKHGSRAPSGAGSPPRSTHRRAHARRSPQTKQTECVSAPIE